MIIFDLKCSQDHAFEGWFENHEDLESQIQRGLVSCPICGDLQVRQVPSGFAIAKGTLTDRDEEALHKLLNHSVKKYLQDQFDDVGTQFAKEALKIHYGVKEPRNIRGVSSPEEEKTLRDEGVSFFKFNLGEDDSQPPLPDSGSGDDDD